MAKEEKKFSPPPHYEENCIVVPVPTGTLKQEIEKQIHDALAEQPQDIFKDRKSRELVIVLQDMGAREPKKS
jgi:hypothetical protein